MANPASKKSDSNPFPIEKRAISRGQFMSKARFVPILRYLTNPELEIFYDRVKFYSVPAETLIIKQGHIGKSVYILLEGNAAVVYSKKENKTIYLSKFKSGDFFGERALFSDGTRNASIYTTTRSKLLKINTSDLKEFIDKHPQMFDVLFAKFEQRVQALKENVIKYFVQLREEERKVIEGEAKFQLAGIKAKNMKAQFGLLKNLSYTGCEIEMDGNQFMKFKTSVLETYIPIVINLQEKFGSFTALGKVVWYEQAQEDDIFGYRFNIGLSFIKLLKDGGIILANALKQSNILTQKET